MTKDIIKTVFKPIYKYIYIPAIKAYGKKHQAWVASRYYKFATGKKIDWKNPKDLNEKINWLKFHENPKDWANLADKYLVRKYVQERNLGDILVPLYGKWNRTADMLADLDKLPDEFVLKCNNGAGLIHIVSNENGGKKALNLKELSQELSKWLSMSDFGFQEGEPHYTLIQNCIIAEKLLKDVSVKSYSQSMVDYKIWCFDGKPFGCLVVYDRSFDTHGYMLDFYDLEWNQRTDYMTDLSPRHKIPKPKNWDKMLEAAEKLSKGHPEVRVDFYNIDGQIYFGEMTFTSYGGYMTYFTQQALEEMGKLVTLDLSLPTNRFWKSKGK